MKIEILGAPEANVIAREIRGQEANFHLRLNGHVMYRSPEDGTEKLAGRSIDVFGAAVEACHPARFLARKEQLTQKES